MTAKVPESFRDTATPQLFLRNATGLVKGWSRFDAFVYSCMLVNFVTLGLYFSLSVLPFVATGQVIPALIISAIFVSFLVFSYAGLISVMPRAGGDYVWQSRVLTPAIGFVLAVTGWWFILWYWAPIYAATSRATAPASRVLPPRPARHRRQPVYGQQAPRCRSARARCATASTRCTC